MYRYSNGQISLADFKQPVGMNLKESNRWVKKAQTIPWPEIEKRYAALFTNRKGNVAKPWALAEQRKMLNQAQKYNSAFDQIIYHTNSVELANYYSDMFKNAGITNWKFPFSTNWTSHRDGYFRIILNHHLLD